MWNTVAEDLMKAAVFHITRQLSFQFPPEVRVNALAPGLVKTRLAAVLCEGAGEDRMSAHIPLRRMGLLDDVATAALFLVSDAAWWVAGQTTVERRIPNREAETWLGGELQPIHWMVLAYGTLAEPVT